MNESKYGRSLKVKCVVGLNIMWNLIGSVSGFKIFFIFLYSFIYISGSFFYV